MSFRSLLADLILGGTLNNAYEIAGTFTVGQVGGVSIVIDGVHDAILFYNASGQLLASLAPAAGSDGSGNTWPIGLRLGQAGNAGVVASIASDGRTGLLYFPGTVPDVIIDAHLQLNQQGADTSQVSFLTIGAATDQTQNDTAFINLFGSSADGTQNTHATLTYQDPTGAVHSYVVVDLTGTTIKGGSLTAVQPGTGTSRATPAAAETWHTATVSSAVWTATGAAQPLRYRLEGIAGGQVRLDGELLTTGAGPWPANNTVVMLPVGYRPIQSKFFISRSDIAVAAGQATVAILSSGGLQNGQAFTAAGQRLFFDGVVFPVD